MQYLLDTNIYIYYLKGLYSLNEKIESIGGLEKCAMSEITLAELKFGAEKSDKKEENGKVIAELCSQVLVIPIFNSLDFYAKEKARLKTVGKIIDDFDLLIGATAIVNNLIMVTHNTKHFERLRGIVLENWVDLDNSFKMGD